MFNNTNIAFSSSTLNAILYFNLGEGSFHFLVMSNTGLQLIDIRLERKADQELKTASNVKINYH